MKFSTEVITGDLEENNEFRTPFIIDENVISAKEIAMKRKHIGMLHLTHVSQKINFNSGNLLFEWDMIKQIPEYTVRIECTREMILSIDTKTSTMSIINFNIITRKHTNFIGDLRKNRCCALL